MENRQVRAERGKKTKKTVIDLRQIGLWSASDEAQAVPRARNRPKDPPHPIENKLKVRSKTPPGRTRVAPVKVTVSGPRPGATPRSAPVLTSGSLPALTRRQHEVLDYLRRRDERGSLPPSLTQICADLGLASRGSLHKQIVALVAANLVEAMHGKQRGVRLVRAANEETSLPLLGAIAAGRPIEALTREESVTVPAWLRTSSECYALRVRGDSMRDAGILDGDIVVVEVRETARNGEMVVALIDGQEATLKRIEQRPGEVLLHAENALYAPQVYGAERVRIQGVVVAQIRRY